MQLKPGGDLLLFGYASHKEAQEAQRIFEHILCLCAFWWLLRELTARDAAVVSAVGKTLCVGQDFESAKYLRIAVERYARAGIV